MAKRKSTADAQGAEQPAKKNAASKGPKAKKASTEPGKVQQLREFFDQSVVEMKKVTWPTRKEAVATSVAVLVLVVFMSLFLGVVDLGLAKAIEAILS